MVLYGVTCPKWVKAFISSCITNKSVILCNLFTHIGYSIPKQNVRWQWKNKNKKKQETCGDHSVHVLSQWETMLHSNVILHWLGRIHKMIPEHGTIFFRCNFSEFSNLFTYNQNKTCDKIMKSPPQTTLTPYMVLPLFATRFAEYTGGIRVSFIQPRLF